MRRRLVLMLVGWASGCGAGNTSRDGGDHPTDGGADGSADGAPSDAGAVSDAGDASDASSDAQVDAAGGRCLEDVCECGESYRYDWSLCPAEAPFCCRGPDDDIDGRAPRCYPTDDGLFGGGLHQCFENPLASAQASDCREWDPEVPNYYVDDPERCPDERPNCCGYRNGPVVCADHVLTGWDCNIGILTNCADRFGTPDSTRCPDDYPICCVADYGARTCTARLPRPEDWECDLD